MGRKKARRGHEGGNKQQIKAMTRRTGRRGWGGVGGELEGVGGTCWESNGWVMRKKCAEREVEKSGGERMQRGGNEDDK